MQRTDQGRRDRRARESAWVRALGVAVVVAHGLCVGGAAAQFGGLGPASPSNEFDVGSGEALDVKGGDVNADGINDIVFIISNGFVGYSAGRTDGIVSQPTLIAQADGDANSLALFDYDQDGDLDVLRTADLSGGELRLFRNNGVGAFSLDFAITGLGAMSQRFGVRLGDYDADGDADVLVLRSAGLTVIENLGNTFSLAPLSVDFPNFTGVALDAGDINGDGRADAVVLSTALNQIVVIESRTTGPVVTGRIAFAAGPADIRLVDIDQDGDLDIIASTTSANRIDVFRNNGTGSFSFGYSLFISEPREFEVADMDADGSLDIVVLARSIPGFSADDRVVIFLNDGKGFFGQHPEVYNMFFNDFNTITVSSISPPTGPDVVAVQHSSDGRVVLRENLTPFIAPASFALVSPSDGASELATPQEVAAWGGRVRPTLEWTPAGGFGVTYDLVIATDPALTNRVVELDGLTTPVADLSAELLSPGVVYYWDVTASNGAGSVTSSGGPFTFSTRGQCPADIAAPFGQLTLSDVLAFLNLFNAGCP